MEADPAFSPCSIPVTTSAVVTASTFEATGPPLLNDTPPGDAAPPVVLQTGGRHGKYWNQSGFKPKPSPGSDRSQRLGQGLGISPERGERVASLGWGRTWNSGFSGNGKPRKTQGLWNSGTPELAAMQCRLISWTGDFAIGWSAIGWSAIGCPEPTTLDRFRHVFPRLPVSSASMKNKVPMKELLKCSPPRAQSR